MVLPVVDEGEQALRKIRSKAKIDPGLTKLGVTSVSHFYTKGARFVYASSHQHSQFVEHKSGSCAALQCTGSSSRPYVQRAPRLAGLIIRD